MPTSSPPPTPAPMQTQIIDQTTVFSLLGTVAVLAAAYGLSLRALPRHSRTKARVLFIWHVFDALIHFIFEGSFLWNCFFVHSSISTPSPPSTSSFPFSFSFSSSSSAPPPSSSNLMSEFLPPNVHFLNLPNYVFGAAYGSGPFSKLWQEYAKADKRWGGTDLTVVSLEVLTVFVGGPLALWCAEMVRRGEWNTSASARNRNVGNRKWFWMIVLATGELYGGQFTGFSFFLFSSGY
jgi:hypothetical protein